MNTEYQVKMSVTLEPVDIPWVTVGINEQQFSQKLHKTSTFDFDFKARERCCLKIEHFGKDDNDPSTAVIVKEISFFGITNPNFVWAGVYVPLYPVHYLDKKTPLQGQDYLGWNGTYTLNFNVPVFTWMHQILNLGWLYQ
jgi:hypothetical protein